MNVLLFGAHAADLQSVAQGFDAITVVDKDPEIIVCYGGDGTLLAAEQRWPGVPKVPIRNSRQGLRLMPHPPEEVLTRLVDGKLHHCEYIKLACELRTKGGRMPRCVVSAMNEVNVHMGRINSAVRFKLWINGEPFDDGEEIIGDGFLVATPFGSTAYYKQIARGVLYTGLGVAFKLVSSVVNHVVVPDTSHIRAVITRGPALMGYDNAPEYYDLQEGDELVMQKAQSPAVLLTWDEMKHPNDAF